MFMVWLVLLLTVAMQAQVVKPAQPSAVVAPDLFWCPMHPNVRSPVEGTCPICRMTLIAIPPVHIGEYRMAVTPVPASSGRGLSGLALRIAYPDTGAPVAAFVRDGFLGPPFITVHDKKLHLFVVSRNLDFFAHLHPEQAADGTFTVRYDFPAGEYMVIADFLPAGGAPQTLQRAIVTPGYNPPARVALAAPRPTGRAAVVAGDVSATMAVRDLVAGKAASVTFTISDSKTGTPVTDLEPYLGAPAHALLASSDLTFATHGHPAAEATSGPAVSFEFLMPTPGRYKLWLQVQRRGRVETLPFVLEVK